jgi:hypothetical protein
MKENSHRTNIDGQGQPTDRRRDSGISGTPIIRGEDKKTATKSVLPDSRSDTAESDVALSQNPSRFAGLCELSAEEARQMRENVAGFFRLLHEWDRAQAARLDGPDALRGCPHA